MKNNMFGKGEGDMKDNWKEEISSLAHCARCNEAIGMDDQRILSVYDHKAICRKCKKDEENAPDYEEVSKKMIGQCMLDAELRMEDPADYCYHHFYPF
jgi:hypothetical protein